MNYLITSQQVNETMSVITEEAIQNSKFLNGEKFDSYVSKWKDGFRVQVQNAVASRAHNFTFEMAVEKSQHQREPEDDIMVQWVKFIESDPLKSNDYYKYVTAYRKGIELDLKYFRHNVDKLHKYYRKFDNDPKYNPFNKGRYERYVLYMMLKFSGLYKPDEHDDIFGIKKVNSREYNPITSVPNVLRGELPFEVKEYDISRAYHTFICMELGIDSGDVYSKIDKVKFNSLINTHAGTPGATLENIREQLKPIYGDNVDKVITEERFNNKGRMFEDMARHEKEYIETFVLANNLDDKFVRLHDAVVVLQDTVCEVLEFGMVKFKIKEFIKPEVINETFTFYNDDWSTAPERYARYLTQEGFLRITQEGNDTVTIVRNEGKVIAPINHKTDLVPFLKSQINEVDTAHLENQLAADSTRVIPQALLLMSPQPLFYHRDTKEQTDIPFEKFVVRITADGMQKIPYDDIDGFFPKHDTQKFNPKLQPIAENLSDFADFLMLATCGEERNPDTFLAVCSMYGAMISNFKNQAKPYAIILSDEGADDVSRKGRRGKSLLTEALKQFRPSITKPGDSYDPTYTHVHADLKLEHDIYIIDDVPKNFNYHALYTHVSNGIDCQRKGSAAQFIQFDDTPKFIVTTNWAVRYDKDSHSTNDRFFEYKFTDYWNIKNKPDEAYGKVFFSKDWTDKEWNAFYNFGFYCVQVFLKHGLIPIKYDKREDNYRAYFEHGAVEEEMQRIIGRLDGANYFTVGGFLKEHKENNVFSAKPIFTHINAKDYITAYIEYHSLPYDYRTGKNQKRWYKIH